MQYKIKVEMYMSDKERAYIMHCIANKEAMIESLEEDNADGRYDNKISALRNEIQGLKYALEND